jgi:hypothetical protein
MEFEHEYLGRDVPKATFVQCSCAAREPPDGYISLLIFCRSELITQVGTLQNPFPQIQTINYPSAASLNKNSILSAETQDLSSGMGDLSQGSKSHHTGSKGFRGMIPSGRLPLCEEHRRRPAIPRPLPRLPRALDFQGPPLDFTWQLVELFAKCLDLVAQYWDT